MNITAKKVQKGSKFIVQVFIDGELVRELGGNRAERATAAIVCLQGKGWLRFNRDGSVSDDIVYDVNLRADADKAFSEAASHRAGRDGYIVSYVGRDGRIYKDSFWSDRDWKNRPRSINTISVERVTGHYPKGAYAVLIEGSN